MNVLKYVIPGNGYVPNFQMFKKIEVNGDNEEPLYSYLKVGIRFRFYKTPFMLK